MIRIFQPIDILSIVFFSRNQLQNISYNFLDTNNGENCDLSIKKCLEQFISYKNFSEYYINTNNMEIQSVINIDNKSNNSIWKINEFHAKKPFNKNIIQSLEKLSDLAAKNQVIKIFISINQNSSLIAKFNDLGFLFSSNEISMLKIPNLHIRKDIPRKITPKELRPFNSSDLFFLYKIYSKSSDINKDYPLQSFNNWSENQKSEKKQTHRFIYEKNYKIKSMIEITSKKNCNYIQFYFFTNNKITIRTIIDTILAIYSESIIYTILPAKNQIICNAFIESGFQPDKNYVILYKNITIPIKFKKKQYRKNLKVEVSN